MIYYKNLSSAVKTFYGVSFKPGEVKGVPGYINNKYMFRTQQPVPQEPPKRTENKQNSSSNKSAKPNKPAVEEQAENPTEAADLKGDVNADDEIVEKQGGEKHGTDSNK